MTGAELLVSTLADLGVAVCFANPGTSEMHLVTALDREPRVRSVLCLFEGVVTGAADGYARIAGKPAMTLLHLGSGLTNAGANLHNARRARSPMINVIGDHAGYHLQYDAPLTSDIAGLARPNMAWIGRVDSADDAVASARAAFARTMAASAPVALILPADSAWNDGVAAAPAAADARQPADPATALVGQRIRSAKNPVILINGSATVEPGLSAAARLAAAGARVVTDTFLWRQERGAGRFAPHRLGYFAEMALAELEGTDLLVLAGTNPPAAFFAYPGKPSLLVPQGCEVAHLCHPDAGQDAGAALAALADFLDAPAVGPVAPASIPPAPNGPLSAVDVAATIARHMPEDSIVADDGVTSSQPVFAQTVGAARHDWLFLTGGAIGMGMPLAVGAAVAAPARKVICLSGDGAGMYTNQALWTMARENLDVLTVVFANRSYRILNIEMARTGAGNPGPTASAMLSLDNPAIDWVMLATAQGVPAVRCETAEHFDVEFARMAGARGPRLIEAAI